MDFQTEIRPGRHIHIAIYNNHRTDDVALLVHGLGGRGDQWREQINYLNQYYNLIIPDLLGHDKSDKPTPTSQHNPYTFIEFQQDIQTLFNKYAGKTNIVLGHSYGGALAAALCLNNHEKINKLCLLTPMPCAPTFKIPMLFQLPLFLMNLIRPLLEKQFKHLAFDPNTDPKLIEIEMQAARNNPMYMIKAMTIGMNKIPNINISQLTTPTQIIIGETDKLVPPASQIKFYHSMPIHQATVIQQAAHLVQLEKPQEVNTTLADFLHL